MNKRPATLTLVIATYNWPAALQCCLQSVLQQVVMPTEVLIADDGSGEETLQVIKKFQSLLPVPLRHIWQADEGFQLARIRNKANAAASSEYIIQIDGDLILHPHFVADHWKTAKPGHFIGGSRVILEEGLSRQLLESSQTAIYPWTKGIHNRFNSLHWPLAGAVLQTFIKTHNAYNIRGCNMSYYKRDFITVNGYDENYKGWGREDTDLVLRFYNSGLRRSWFKLRGVAYHLWHREASREALAKNDATLQKTVQKGTTRCDTGVDQYL